VGESEAMPWTVRYFVDDDLSLPAEVFEDSLDTKLKAKLLTFIEQVALNEGDLGGGILHACHGSKYSSIFEIRAKRGTDLARSLCYRDGCNLILLGGVSKSLGDETPVRNLDEAASRLSRY
jgi:hypothetical protein